MKRVLPYLLPPEWRNQLRTLRHLNLIFWPDALIIGASGVAALAFEVFSVAMILPLLDYIEAGRDIAVLTARSQLWRMIADVAGVLNVPISLASLSATIVVLVVLRQIANYIHMLQVIRIKQRVGRDLSATCFRAVLESSAAFMKDVNSGKFVNLLNNQCQHVASLIRSYAAIVQTLLSFLAYGTVMVVTAPGASLLALAVAVLVVLSLSRYIRMSRRISQRTMQVRREFCGFMAERHQAWPVIKLSDTLPTETEKFIAWAQRFFHLSVDLQRVAGRIQLIVAPLMTACALAALYGGVEYFALSLSVVTLFVLMILRLVPVAQGLANQRQALATHGAALDEVVETLAAARQHRERDTGTAQFEGVAKAITFRNVHFRYATSDRAAINGVDVTIPAAAMTAVMGPSGAGKSTLVDMIPRLVGPDSGTILLDGQPLESFTLSSLRRGISYAPQQHFVFNASVTENVRYGRPDAAEADVRAACEAAHAASFIERLPQGYDTLLGESGGRLSGGQRQRIALARAFVSRARILILDEPTSELDYESEREIRAALETMVRAAGMTVIVVAHRMSTVRSADHVVVLTDGRVLEQGPPAALGHDDQWYGAMLALDRGASAAAE